MSQKLRIVCVVLITVALIVAFTGAAIQNIVSWLLGGVVSLFVRVIVVFVRILTFH